MINTSTLQGKMQPWYYPNAKEHNKNLLLNEIKEEAATAEQKNQNFDFKGEYEKAAQKLGLFDPTGDIHLVSDIKLSDKERIIFKNMHEDAQANGIEPMSVSNIALNYHLDEMLANQGGSKLPLDESYLQRLMKDFERTGSAVRVMDMKPSTIQYFEDNFSKYAVGQYMAANNAKYSHPLLDIKT